MLFLIYRILPGTEYLLAENLKYSERRLIVFITVVTRSQNQQANLATSQLYCYYYIIVLACIQDRTKRWKHRVIHWEAQRVCNRGSIRVPNLLLEPELPAYVSVCKSCIYYDWIQKLPKFLCFFYSGRPPLESSLEKLPKSQDMKGDGRGEHWKDHKAHLFPLWALKTWEQTPYRTEHITIVSNILQSILNEITALSALKELMHARSTQCA